MDNCGVCGDPQSLHLRGGAFCIDGIRIARNVMDIIFKHAVKRMKLHHERSCIQFNFKIWSIYPELCSLFQAANVLSRQPGDTNIGPTFNFEIKSRVSCYLLKPSWHVENQILHRRSYGYVESKKKKRAQIFQPRKIQRRGPGWVSNIQT